MAKRNTTTRDSKMTLVRFILKEVSKKNYHLFYFASEALVFFVFLPSTVALQMLGCSFIGYCIYVTLILPLCFYSPLNTKNRRPVLIRPFNGRNDFSTDTGESSNTFIRMMTDTERARVRATSSSLFHAQIVHGGRKRDSIKREAIGRSSSRNHCV